MDKPWPGQRPHVSGAAYGSPDVAESRLAQPVTNKPFLDVLTGQRREVPPVWKMQQAGRYLPEYRELRTMAGGFLDHNNTPEHTTKDTQQPIRRFGFDAAII